MTDDMYNGWTNRETWAVALHINNDQGWQESVYDALREADYNCGDHDEPMDRFEEAHMGLLFVTRRAGEIVKDNVESWIDDDDDMQAQVTWLKDIGSLWRVNWDEIGASFLCDLEEA